MTVNDTRKNAEKRSEIENPGAVGCRKVEGKVASSADYNKSRKCKFQVVLFENQWKKEEEFHPKPTH